MKFLFVFLIFSLSLIGGQRETKTSATKFKGVLRDAYNKRVPNADVTIERKDKKCKLKSDENGEFEVKLANSDYTFVIKRDGFKKHIFSEIEIKDNNVIEKNFPLEFGQCSHCGLIVVDDSKDVAGFYEYPSIEAPIIKSKPEPEMTMEAKKNKLEGKVILRVLLLSSGNIVKIVPIETLPYGLTEKAISAAQQVKFESAKLNGKPVSVHYELEYEFSWRMTSCDLMSLPE